MRGHHGERGLAVLGRSTKERGCAESNDVPLVLLAPEDTLHSGRGGAWPERVLVEHDDKSTVLVHVKRFVEEGPVILRFLHHHDVENRLRGDAAHKNTDNPPRSGKRSVLPRPQMPKWPGDVPRHPYGKSRASGSRRSGLSS